MLPIVVLRGLDCVLEPTTEAALKRRDYLEAQQMPEAAMDRLLGKASDPERMHPLYNTNPYPFARLLGDAENIAPNLVSYINGIRRARGGVFPRRNVPAARLKRCAMRGDYRGASCRPKQPALSCLRIIPFPSICLLPNRS